MAEESFKISLIGEGGQFVKTLQQAEDELKDFEKAMKNATNVDAFKAATEGAKRTQAAIAGLHKATGDFAKGNARATASLTDLSRIAQDAPYGFIGIANNINPLIESFQRLKAETGSTKAALSGMGAALMGPAGVGLAIGVVSSLLVVFGDKLFNTKEKTLSLKEATDKYLESLNDVAKVELKGAQAGQEDIVKLKTLYEATQNANIPLEKRKQLVDQLQEQYPKYFANISDEIVLAGGAKKAYTDLSAAILASAQARAGQDLLIDIQKQLIVLDYQAAEAKNELKKRQDALTNSVDKTYKAVLNSRGSDAAALSGQTRIAGATAKVAEQQSKVNDFLKQTNELRKRAAQITGKVTGIIEANPDALIPTRGSVPKVKIPKVKAVGKVEIDLSLADVDFDPTFKPFVDGHKMFIDSMGQLAEKRDGPAIPGLPTAEDQLEWNKKMKAARAQTLAEQAAFQAQMAALMESFVENSLTGFGEALGEALSGSISGDPLQGFRMLVGNLIQDMGKLLIQAGIKAEVFQKALLALSISPAAKIAIGVGLVAAGTIIKSSKPRRFAEGGIVSGPTYGLMGEYAGARNNPEVIAPLDKLEGMLSNKGGGEVIVINERRRGKDMLLQASRANRSKNYTS